MKSELFMKGDPAARKSVPAPCPEWPELDGKVWITELGDDEFLNYIDNLPDDDKGDKLRVARFLVFVLVYEDGKRIFDTDVIEMVKLSKLPVRVIRRWDAIAKELNHFGGTAKALEKNSDAADTTTSSPNAA